MRGSKIFAVSFMFLISATSLPAQSPFYAQNSDLKRVGSEQILKISKIKYAGGNYRLDPDFRLGYGDTVNVNLWGKFEAVHKLTIQREGDILIPLVGKVYVFGLTLEEARAAIRQEVDKRYTNVELDITLADVQDIRIMVLGNVTNPGPYPVSPFSKVVDALMVSGGPNQEGSLTDIRIIRGGKPFAVFDAFDLLIKGDESKNILLKQGDIVFIPAIKNLVALRGEVRYPGIYEIKDGEQISHVIETAGGMRDTELARKIIVLRTNPQTLQTEIFKQIMVGPHKALDPNDDLMLKNYDSLIVTVTQDYSPEVVNLFESISVRGEVNIPGTYLIKKGEKLSSVLKRAGGLKNYAYVPGVVLSRNSLKAKNQSVLDELIRAQEKALLEETDSWADTLLKPEEKELRQRIFEYKRKALKLMASRAVSGRIIINLEDILKGNADMGLEGGDSLQVPITPDWVLVTGAVVLPQSVLFDESKGLEYYLNSVGGANKHADKEEIYIIKPDGRAETKATGFSKIMKGDIIVVPEK